MNGIKNLKLAAITGLALMATSGLGTQAEAAFVKVNPANVSTTVATTAPVILAGSHQKTIAGGLFRTRDGSNLYNEYRMPDNNTLRARRHVSTGPGPWGTFTRVSTDTFRSSKGDIYTIIDANTLQYNGGRFLFRD